MARILSQESSLKDHEERILRENRSLQRLNRYLLRPLAFILTISGVIVYFARGQLWLLIGAGVVLFFSFSYTIKIRENEIEQKITGAGRRGESKVSKKLARDLPRDTYVLNDVMIRHGGKSAQIDHIVLTSQGLFLLETKNWNGRIVGDENDEQWMQIKQEGRKTVKVGNPVKQCARHLSVLRDYFSSAGIQWPDIESCVVFASGGSQLEVKSASCPLLHLPDISDYILGYAGSRTYSESEIDEVLNLFMKVP